MLIPSLILFSPAVKYMICVIKQLFLYLVFFLFVLYKLIKQSISLYPDWNHQGFQEKYISKDWGLIVSVLSSFCSLNTNAGEKMSTCKACFRAVGQNRTIKLEDHDVTISSLSGSFLEFITDRSISQYITDPLVNISLIY